MKKINIKVIRSMMFLLGLAVILKVSSGLFLPKNEMYNSVAVEEKQKSLDEEVQNTIDVIFMGDSESYSAFSPLQIWAEYGYTSYVCGTSAQRLCDTYALLQYVFEKQSPKLIVLETNCLYRQAGFEEKSMDQMLAAASEYFPIFQYHSRWKTYVSNIALPNEQIIEEKRMKGFRLRTTSKSYQGKLPYMKESSGIKEVPETAQGYVEKINQLCKENGAKLVLASVPSAKNWNYERHNGVEKLAQAQSVEYWDLNLVEEIGIDWHTDTRDGGDHLNFEGAKKVTAYVGNYISEKFLMTDHREDETYQKWYEHCDLLGL